MALTATRPPFRLGLLGLAAIGLLAGLWAGLIRLGWAVPSPDAALAAAHGPLMVADVLGVVIGLERAVALGRTWAFLAPIAAGLGGLALIAGLPVALGAGLFTASSLLLIAIFVQLFQRRPEWASAMLAAGAALWLVGNVLWLAGRSLPEVVPWWAGFLVLTIAGERLELAQVLMPARVQGLLLGASGLLVVGLIVSVGWYWTGVQIGGVGLIGLAAWLVRYDVARRTVRRRGVAQFSAVCLLLGYGWLGLGGLFWLLGPSRFPGAFWYDAMVHSVFLGFVFSMIFGHAPTIIPAVTGIQIPFQRVFYLHVGVLHLSLALRILGDLTTMLEARAWGGLLNVVAILIFAALTVRAALRPSPPLGAVRARPGGTFSKARGAPPEPPVPSSRADAPASRPDTPLTGH
ncbi:MAG: hypothetical protein IT305_30280 [Chloroflexi bacterium]|nr:hypothetical protein [Chloroflexota bacterium]